MSSPAPRVVLQPVNALETTIAASNAKSIRFIRLLMLIFLPPDLPTGGYDTNRLRRGVSTRHGLNPANRKALHFYSSAEVELRFD
jgi:hypothetical protein